MSSTQSSLILRSKHVVTPSGIFERAIWIQGEQILKVIPPEEIPQGMPVEDYGELVIMPGLVDSHVHINEPGRTDWEGFETATRAAAAGGITTLIDMPLNCIPVTTTVKALEAKIKAAQNQLWVDCGFYGGLIPNNLQDLAPLIEAGVMGFKTFLIHSGIDDFPNVTRRDLEAAMPIIAQGKVPLLVHAELDCHAGNVAYQGNPKQYETFLSSRPRAWEMDAIQLMIELCETYHCPVHIVHLSCADALPLLQDARKKGLPLSVETCPHYLGFSSEAIAEGDTRYKCAPPIREKENQDRLWQGLGDGTIDFIVSDHSPCTPELKLLEQGDFMASWGGISSLQFGLSMVWTQARQRGYTLSDMAQWMCARPAQFSGLGRQKGAILPGCDADLVIWDPNETFTVTPEKIQHRHKVSPYTGLTLQGVVHHTFLRGHKIFSQGQFLSPHMGKPLFRQVHALQGGCS